MLAVSGMAVQNALVRVSLTGAPSTAVMTTNVSVFTMDIGEILFGQSESGRARARVRAQRTWPAIVGFLLGCVLGLFDLTRCYDACSETLLVVAVTTMIKTRILLSHAELKLDRHDRLKRAESVGKTRACAEALGSGNLITCGFCRLKQNRCNHSNRTKAIVGPRHTFPVTPGLLQTRFIQQTTLRMQE
jgi:hypothetical protein